MIKLFNIEGKTIKPTEHCYMIPFLKAIMDKFPDDYIQIYGYLFYMCAPSSENPYRGLPEYSKERVILNHLKSEFDPENPIIREALRKTELLYDTPSRRAHRGVKTMIDKLALFFENEQLTAGGRDGNLASIVNSVKQFDQIRKSFKGIEEDLEEEQKSLDKVRGGSTIAFDLTDDDADEPTFEDED
jgi:hypothetical protein